MTGRTAAASAKGTMLSQMAQNLSGSSCPEEARAKVAAFVQQRSGESYGAASGTKSVEWPKDSPGGPLADPRHLSTMSTDALQKLHERLSSDRGPADNVKDFGLFDNVNEELIKRSRVYPSQRRRNDHTGGHQELSSARAAREEVSRVEALARQQGISGSSPPARDVTSSLPLPQRLESKVPQHLRRAYSVQRRIGPFTAMPHVDLLAVCQAAFDNNIIAELEDHLNPFLPFNTELLLRQAVMPDAPSGDNMDHEIESVIHLHFQNDDSPFGCLPLEEVKAIVLDYAAAGELKSLKHSAALSSTVPAASAMQDSEWTEPSFAELRRGVEVQTGPIMDLEDPIVLDASQDNVQQDSAVSDITANQTKMRRLSLEPQPSLDFIDLTGGGNAEHLSATNTTGAAAVAGSSAADSSAALEPNISDQANQPSEQVIVIEGSQ
eukprot:scaffold39373_cov43-Prasinocladus_malaysianus.AAC.1